VAGKLQHGARTTGGFLRAGERPTLMRDASALADDHPDPMDGMGNLFDVAILIGIGFMVVALTGFGLKDMLTNKSVTIVKDPGTPKMEIITKDGANIERLKTTDEQAQGLGAAVGTVYKLQDGRMIWVPGTTTPDGQAPAPAPTTPPAVPNLTPSVPGTTAPQ
jgi:hypothetical protein